MCYVLVVLISTYYGDVCIYWSDSYAYTVEPVNPDSGKSGHLHITDIKLLSRIFLHLKLVFRHLKSPDTSVFRNQDSHLQSRYMISS